MDYTELFHTIRDFCSRGQPEDIDEVMTILDRGDLPVTRAVDLYLGQVSKSRGIERLEYYLFQGSQIQRNYCTLFFARRNEWSLINRAFQQGRIDRIQAYSR